MVRIEALSRLTPVDSEFVCLSAVAAVDDEDRRVALGGLDRLATCGALPDAVTVLERQINDLSQAGTPRGWHRAAHAIVALAGAAPYQARSALGQFTDSTNWHLRVYAARAAAVLGDEQTLRRLAQDPQDNVAEAALSGLSQAGVSGRRPLRSPPSAAAPIRWFVLRRARWTDRQNEAAVPALRAALQRLTAEGRRTRSTRGRPSRPRWRGSARKRRRSSHPHRVFPPR